MLDALSISYGVFLNFHHTFCLSLFSQYLSFKAAEFFEGDKDEQALKMFKSFNANQLVEKKNKFWYFFTFVFVIQKLLLELAWIHLDIYKPFWNLI